MSSPTFVAIQRRSNGLSRPYSSAQIAAWVAMVASLLQFVLVICPILDPCAVTPILMAFGVTVFAVLHAGAQTILIDPVDVHLCRHLREQQQQQNGDDHLPPVVDPLLAYNKLNNPLHKPPSVIKNSNSWLDAWYVQVNGPRQALPLPVDEDMKQCWICDTQVAEHSMHCKFCNKCVYHFDHHCMWLNTCIGQANYASFFRTLLALFAMEVLHLAVQLYLIIDILLGGPSQRRADAWIFRQETTMVFLFLFLAFNAVSIILIGQLIHFHRSLQRANLSTYQFIVQDHKTKRAQARLAGDLEAKRVVLIAKAEQERQTGTALKLKIGGMCRQMGCAALDPLDMPKLVEPDPEAGFASVLGAGPFIANGNSNGNGDLGEMSTHTRDKVDEEKELEQETTNEQNPDTAEPAEQLVDLMYEVGLPTTPADMNAAHYDTMEDLDDTNDSAGMDGQEDGVEVDTNDNISSPTTAGPRNMDITLTPAGFGDTSDDQLSVPDDHLDSSSANDDGDSAAENFQNEPDDRSYKSGCSGRSYRSGRSSKSGKAKSGERDYTAF